MYKTIYDKKQIFDFIIENASYESNVLDRAMLDQNFNVYIERNLRSNENILRADLIIERNSLGDAIHTLYESHRILGDLTYYVTMVPRILAKDVQNLYMKANSRKHEIKKEETNKITATELTDTMRTFSSPNNAVYYICNLTTGLISDRRVQFLYKHPAFDKIEFVSDKDSRCTWFYSERDVKNFIAKHRYYLTYDCDCANPFVVKSKRIGRVTERKFYNLDLNEERYDLYGPVAKCCKRLARYSQIGDDKPYDKIYFHASSHGPYADYIKRDIESSIWTQRYINNKLKEIMKEMNLPKIKRVIFNNPATIVFWADDTKTIVKCENEEFDPEKGLSMAISKKALGNKHDYYNVFKKWLPKEKKDDKNKKPAAKEKKSTNKKNNK